MWEISKTIDFCFGHRVWTQKLNSQYADDLKCACRHLHGHEGKVEIFLQGDTLTDGFITDFRHLEWLKKWLNANVDHQFIIDASDPLFPTLVGNRALVPVYVPGTTHLAGHKLDLSDIEPNTPMFELFEGFFVVGFVPTSENLSKWLAELVQAKMSLIGINVSRVDWWETPRSRSSYRVAPDKPFTSLLKVEG